MNTPIPPATPPLDEMYHTYSGEGYVITRCSLCESIVSTDPLDTSTAENEPHYYMDNVCYVCGYTNTCTHPEDSLQNWNYIANQTYEYISDKLHKVSGTLIVSKDCMLCGQSLGESIEDENYVAEERHNFYGADSNCYGCGVTNPCPHPEESRLSDSFMAETLSITCDDEKYHTAVGTMCYLEQCLRCGTYVSETYADDQSLRSVHYFHNGVCDCGFENSCEHPADRLREDIGYTHNRAEAISATQHTGEVTKNVQTICTLCHESLPGVITSNETLTSNHIFSGGVCWVCNYVNECTHPESARKDTTVIYSHDYTVISSDADTHTLSGFCYASIQCSDCGESLSGKYVNDGTATEPHDFLNGICCICNAAE